MSEVIENGGKFAESLVRNNSQIRKDRATAIAEDTQLVFKRSVEDIEIKLKQMKRERESMLDLSPTTATSLVLASEFDSQAFVEKDIRLGIDIRNTEIKYEVALARYTELFGDK